MKKLVLLSVLGLAFVSCQKDYTCNCDTTTITTTETYDDFFDEWTTETTTITSETQYTFRAKKNDAQSICSAYNASTETFDVSSTTTCSLSN